MEISGPSGICTSERVVHALLHFLSHIIDYSCMANIVISLFEPDDGPACFEYIYTEPSYTGLSEELSFVLLRNRQLCSNDLSSFSSLSWSLRWPLLRGARGHLVPSLAVAIPTVSLPLKALYHVDSP